MKKIGSKGSASSLREKSASRAAKRTASQANLSERSMSVARSATRDRSVLGLRNVKVFS